MTGYGMVLYRYGACAAAAVLEAGEQVSGVPIQVCDACGHAVFPRAGALSRLRGPPITIWRTARPESSSR